MGVQAMASSKGGKQPHSDQSLMRQGSLYNLTLDEIQNQFGDLGKPLSSMNMDELLKNLWSAKENRSITLGVAPDNPNQQSLRLDPPLLKLPQQGNISLTHALSTKTVDEVWRDIQQGRRKKETEKVAQHQQLPLGEMTLEDFLVKAGVVAEVASRNGCNENSKIHHGGRSAASVMGIDPTVADHNFQQQSQWVDFQIPASSTHQHVHAGEQSLIGCYMPNRAVPTKLGINSRPVLEAVFTENNLFSMPSPVLGAFSDAQSPGRKRVAPEEVIGKTGERKQKRMIKNRESAARSRARKQAYTSELENKVSHLEEENERLRKQKELQNFLCAAPQPEPKHQLRRTNSAPL